MLIRRKSGGPYHTVWRYYRKEVTTYCGKKLNTEECTTHEIYRDLDKSKFCKHKSCVLGREEVPSL